MDDHPFEATGFFRPGWGEPRSRESSAACSWVLRFRPWWLYESHGHPLTTTGSYSRPPTGHNKNKENKDTKGHSSF